MGKTKSATTERKTRARREGRRPVHGRIWPSGRTTRKVLLICGIVASVLYVAADVLGTLRYAGYSYADQQVSELTAAGAPTRPLMLALFTAFNVLVAAFGAGVWTSAGPKRAARIAGAMLVAYAAAGQVTMLFLPMATREVLAAGGGTLFNAMHGPGTAVMSLFLVLAIGFGATLFGRRFRWYSIGTIITLVVFGVLVSLQIPQIAANQPTPWMGVAERINIYANMLWFVVLAIALLRARVERPKDNLYGRSDYTNSRND